VRRSTGSVRASTGRGAGALHATWPVLLRRVVLVPEHGEQLVVAHPLGVVLDLDSLGVAGAAAADGAVVGMVHGAADVPHGGRDDAVDLHEGVLDVPETPGCEGGLLCHVALSSFSIDDWYVVT